jgi:hypothetical protein
MNGMSTITLLAARLGRDQSGQVTLEWTLIMVAVVLPCYYLMRIFLNLLIAQYQMVSFLQTLPFP